MCCCQRPCKCKLSIVCLCLASITTFLQVICAYLDRFEDEYSTGAVRIVSMLLTASIAGVNCFQIGLKKEVTKEEEINKIAERIAQKTNSIDKSTKVVYIDNISDFEESENDEN